MTEPAGDEIAKRREKLKALRARGVAYPNNFFRQHLCGDLLEKYEDVERNSLDTKPVVVGIAGRIMRKRAVEKASFATVQDMSGHILIYVTNSYPGKAEHEAFKEWDVGDIIGVEGVLFKTQNGELAVRAKKLRLLTKSLRALPDNYARIAEGELKYRERYVDLIMSEETRLRFVQRARMIEATREFLNSKAFLEIETPMMQATPGNPGADAFVTHHNALDTDFYLRVASESYLKRLVVGGFEKVFELNRTFRNESGSEDHNQESTTLEFCCAHVDYGYIMWFIEAMLLHVARTAMGTTKLTYRGHEIDLEGQYDRLTVRQAIGKARPELDDAALDNREAIAAELDKLGATCRPEDALDRLHVSLFDHTVKNLLIKPTFILGQATDASAHARRSDKDAETAEAFELYIGGCRIAQGVSELNDPEERSSRFQGQIQQKGMADAVTTYLDADYIRALEYGLPPTAGGTIAMDRLIMLLTDSASIRDVILFPALSPQHSG